MKTPDNDFAKLEATFEKATAYPDHRRVIVDENVHLTLKNVINDFNGYNLKVGN
ncbi:MAG TPA: hypothetical protein VGB63_06345 [Pedobacter sp.]|jgi:hypothetical protein